MNATASGNDIPPAAVVTLLDAPVWRLVAREMASLGADEGSVWWCDSAASSLTIVLNTGPHRDALVGRFAQPLGRGLISMVFATAQPFCENDVVVNRQQDSTLDRTLGVRTGAMTAVPLVVSGDVTGVVSCVQLDHPDHAPGRRTGFDPGAVLALQDLATVVGRLIDHAARRSVATRP